MVHSLKLKHRRVTKIPDKVKLCLSVDRETIRRLALLSPKDMKPQEAIRQIVDFYMFHKELDW